MLFLIPAIEVAGAYALRRTLPFTVKKSLELLKRETNLDILTKGGQRVAKREDIPRGDTFSRFSPKEDFRPTLTNNTIELEQIPEIVRSTAVRQEYKPVREIERPTAITEPFKPSATEAPTNLLTILNQKNRLIEDSNQLKIAELELMYSQIEQMEIANRLKESEIFTSIENMTALVTMLYDINASITLISEAVNTGVVSASEDMGKYFSSVSTYFDFMNTGKVGEKEDFFSKEAIPVTLTDNDGNPIIPREVKVRKDFEKHKETKEMNETDFSHLVDFPDYEDPMKLVVDLFQDLKTDVASLKSLNEEGL